jgi:hypothetical protein
MIHLIVGDNAAENLRAAFDLDENLKGEVVVLKDTLGIGPIATDQNSHDEIRTAFWQSLSGEGAESVEDEKNIQAVIQKAEADEEPVCLWLAPNVSDVCAYYYLLTQFKEYPGIFHVINIDSLPFFNEKGAIFYPKNFSEVLPKEFVKTKRLLKEVTPADYETEWETWGVLQAENAMVRVHKGGRDLESADETFYDNSIYYTVNKEPQRGSKIIRQALAKVDQAVSDIYLYSRLEQMVKNEQIICDQESPKHLEKANFHRTAGFGIKNDASSEESEEATEEN